MDALQQLMPSPCSKSVPRRAGWKNQEKTQHTDLHTRYRKLHRNVKQIMRKAIRISCYADATSVLAANLLLDTTDNGDRLPGRNRLLSTLIGKSCQTSSFKLERRNGGVKKHLPEVVQPEGSKALDKLLFSLSVLRQSH
jgi:hypothetical protein